MTTIKDAEEALAEFKQALTEGYELEEIYGGIDITKKLANTIIAALTQAKQPAVDGCTCCQCGKECDPLAMSPSKWPIVFPKPDGTGVPKTHCTLCVAQRVYHDQAKQPEPVDDTEGHLIVSTIAYNLGKDEWADEFIAFYGDGKGWSNSRRAACGFLTSKIEELLSEAARRYMALSDQNGEG